MSVREGFVERFGEDEARRIEQAGEEHVTDTHGHDYRGTDPFKYLFLAAVAFECVGRYRDYHHIETSEDELRAWALESGDLASHDGDVPDYLALMCGAYGPWLVKEDAQ